MADNSTQLPLFPTEQPVDPKPGAGRCSLCGAAILWRDHESTRRAMPINVEPDDKGKIALLPGGLYRFVPVSEQVNAQVARNRGEEIPPRYTSHMDTCPVYVARQKQRRARGNRSEQ
jgi:hypothetical protein